MKNITDKNKSKPKKTTKRTRRTQKVYIPKWKILIMCTAVILVCLLLLLATTLVQKNDKSQNFTPSEISIENIINDNGDRDNQSHSKGDRDKQTETNGDRDNQSKSAPAEEKKSDVKKQETEKKVEQKTEQKPVKETKTEPVPVEKKTSPVEEKKTEPVKNSESVKKTEPAANTNLIPAVTKTTVDSSKTDESRIPPIQSFDFPRAVNNAQLVFLFDDGGQSLSQLEKFINLPFPITVAVLPKLQYSRECADKVRKSGNELMLHQPMQAVNLSVNPGPGAIKPDMTEEEIIKTINQNLNELGPIAGINNHEGSAITADANKMETILKLANRHGIFFLDSRTNKDTQVPYVSKELGYTYFERNGNFLDNTKTRDNALSMIRKNLDIANKNGVVIMIGHIWSADYLPKLLQDIYPELKAKGYTITTVSKSKGRK